MKKLLVVLVIIIGSSLQAQNREIGSIAASSTSVRISSGIVRGIEQDGVASFKGIPYAAPPVGEYRWRAPQPVQPWQGELDASNFKANCAQAGWPRGSGKIAQGSLEDCLYLNIWLPAGGGKDAKLPVMVWVHGGGFVGGSSADRSSWGEQFARQQVILITFNYRLGRLGHFAFPALSDEYPEEPKGSYAYMDQIAALEWVRDNISAFGGDPGKVTVFGESAGGVSVHSLLSIPAAKGLFHRAIIESGGGRDGVLTGRPIRKENADPHYPVSAETIGINFARKHGIDGTDANALAKLRSLSVEEIVDGGMENYGSTSIPIYSGPILDGKLVVETAESAYKSGRQPHIPIIIGSNSAEVPGGFINASSKEELLSLFGNLKDEAIAAYDPDGTLDFPKLMTMVTTDKVWAEPARFTANAFAAKDIPAYVYLFSYVPATMRERFANGAPHGSEIPYVFNNLEARYGIDSTTPEDKEVARMMNTYWANFAKTGNPNGSGLPEWPLYNPRRNEIIEFRPDGSAIGTPDPKKARLDVIENLVDPKNEPLVIESQGSFTVGGSVITNPGTFNPYTRTPEGQTFHGDHAYITYQIPVKARRLPLVFWHGIGQFSKTWETTPDGRDGFQNIFLRRGFGVYLITQPRRGNAGRSTVPVTIKPTPDEQEWFSTFRLGVWPDFFEGVQFDRSEETLNQYFRQITPNMGEFDTQVITSAISALFNKIGNGILVTHSHSGGFGWLTAIDNPNVKAIASYEPGSGFVFPEGEVPDPIPGSSGPLTARSVPMEDFMKLTKIPIIIYYGDFIPEKQVENPGIDGWRARLEMARKWRDVVNKYGGDVTVVHLPEIGIKGNTHFPFSDLNNIEIADLLSEWLKQKKLD